VQGAVQGRRAGSASTVAAICAPARAVKAENPARSGGSRQFVMYVQAVWRPEWRENGSRQKVRNCRARALQRARRCWYGGVRRHAPEVRRTMASLQNRAERRAARRPRCNPWQKEATGERRSENVMRGAQRSQPQT